MRGDSFVEARRGEAGQMEGVEGENSGRRQRVERDSREKCLPFNAVTCTLSQVVLTPEKFQLQLGRFTIQIRDYDSKSHFLMSRESPIQFSIHNIFY